MAIPAGISTALVHLDAPVSFIGDPGQLHVTIKSSVPLVWAATGTPLANFIDNINPGEGTELSVELPHTDQDGFLDGNGNTFKGWSYIVEITYEKSGEQVHFPTREFQILVGQDSVDLALVPAGESYVPVVAPILPVTSMAGFTGAVTLAQLKLDKVDNVRDIDKPISTMAQAALDVKYPKFAANMATLQDLNTYTTSGTWNLMSNSTASGGANYPVPYSGLLEVFGRSDGTAALQRYTRHGANEVWVREFFAGTWTAWSRVILSSDPTATGAAQGLMSAADKAKLDAAGFANSNSNLVMRNGTGDSNLNQLVLNAAAPVNASHAARKDYVDSKVAAVTYSSLGVVPTSSLPPLAINETFPVASQAAMLALVAQRGDMAIRSDINRTFVLATDSPGTLADWKEISAAGQVVSVAGKTGTVALVKADVGLDQVDNTSDAAKPVSTAQQTALNLKAPLANPTFTGTVSGVTKTHVGLGNVDNTSDVNKPVSTAQAAAFVPRWKSGAVYAVGDPVVTPLNIVMTAAVAHTSGATFAGDIAKWTGPNATPYGWMGKTNAFQQLTSGAWVTVTMDTAQELRGGMTFDNAADALVVPVTGRYRAHLKYFFTGGAANLNQSTIAINGVRSDQVASTPAGIYQKVSANQNKADGNDIFGHSYGVIPLNAGDKVSLLGYSAVSTWGSNGYDGASLELDYAGGL